MNNDERIFPKPILSGRSIDMTEAIEKERFNRALRSLPARCWECRRYGDDLCKMSECEYMKEGRVYGW